MKKLLLALATGFLATPAHAKIIFFGTDREKITVSPNTTTILRFTEEVKTISQAEEFEIVPADAANPDYRVLALKPRYGAGSRNISFILANDAVVNTVIYAVDGKLPEKIDSFYDFKPKEVQIDPVDNQIGNNVTETELMKAMIRSDEVMGYKVQNESRPVNSGIDGIKATLLRVYAGPKFNGYVFRIENISADTAYGIDVKSLALGRPNSAMLSQVDDAILNKGKSTLLRIVAKPSSVYYALVLPVEPILKK